MNARYLCEIGTKQGGTLVLLMQFLSATTNFVSVDITMPFLRQIALAQAKQRDQQLKFIVADSHKQETLDKVRSALQGNELDVLFIDGDHAYEGVKTDFELYSPLVREGGIIVFHDIMKDFRTRQGIQTESKTGGVPQFWQEIKASYTVTELIDNPDQDGYGIGIIHW